MKLPFLARLVFNRYFFEKAFAFATLALVIWALQDFLFIFLITFLFAFLFSDLAEYGKTKFAKLSLLAKHKSLKRILEYISTENILIILIYIVFLVGIFIVISGFIPRIIEESKGLLRDIPQMTSHISWIIGNIQNSVPFDLGIDNFTDSLLSKDTLQTTFTNVVDNLKVTGIFLGKIVIGLVLSFVFLMDRHKISNYLSSIKGGNFEFLYDEYAIIFSKIGKGFGLIFKAQAIIAFVNAVLTVIGLTIISFIHGGDMFPYIATIALMVFIFGFVPVLGFIISSIPMLLIGYNYGGATIIISVMVMIGVVHSIEAYYLNPKIVSSYTDFPVFITFLVLLLSEHLFGMVGFLIGIPLFYILMDVLEDIDRFITKIRKTAHTIDTAKTTTKEAISKNIRLSRSQGRSEE